MDFAYCFDCCELTYALPDHNKGIHSCTASNHYGHRQITLEAPDKYPPPIRNVLIKLDKGLTISDNEMVLFALAVDLGGLGNPPAR